MDAAARLLARGWFRDSRRWWLGTAAVIALMTTLVMVVAGSFAGMEHASRARIEDFFTHDVRVTAGAPGAGPELMFPEGTLANASAADPTVVGHIESSFVLSRRSFLDAYLEEDERFRVAVPGGADDPDQYALGLLVGVDAAQPGALDRLRPYRVVGAFPTDDGDDTVDLMLPADRLERLVSEEERANLTQWPPTAAELARFRFEITTARVEAGPGPKDVIRLPARVVGLYETGLDALDSFTAILSIEDARRLLGHEPDADTHNVLLGGPALTAWADDEGWQHEGPERFGARYVGQLLDVVAGLALTVTVLFYAMPVFLLWFGLVQALERQGREIAVARAIGVHAGTLRHATGRLLVQVTALGLGLAALLTLAVGTWLSAVLPGWSGSPLPLEFRVTATTALLGVVLVVAGAGAAWVGSLRRHRVGTAAEGMRAN